MNEKLSAPAVSGSSSKAVCVSPGAAHTRQFVLQDCMGVERHLPLSEQRHPCLSEMRSGGKKKPQTPLIAEQARNVVQMPREYT